MPLNYNPLAGSTGTMPDGLRLAESAMPMPASRLTARAALRDRIERLYREAKQLEALDKALPLELSPAADEALWALVIASR